MSVSALAPPRRDDTPPRGEFEDVPAAADPTGPAWSLRRNCSMAPRCLAAVLGLLAGVSAAIALFFWHRGAVLVVPFAAVEVAALGAAFLWYARHATDGDRLWFQGGTLVVESECGGRVERRSLDASWLDVQPPRASGDGIVLRSGSHRLVVGRHVPAARRARVAREIRQTLRERRLPGGM